MRIELLGPLAAQVNGVSIAPRATKPCQILALLAFNADRLVSKSAIFEELWGSNPPPGATTTLHTYIHQLRRNIDKALGHRSRLTSREILVTERTGYSLCLHGGDTDVQEFTKLSRPGIAAFESGDFPSASDMLRKALAVWRSQVLSDIQIGPLLALEASSLDDVRLAVLNRRIEVDLQMDRHLEIIGELRTLTVQNPVNENYAAHYMTSLYNSGRVGEALREYQRIRTTLVEELGIEPAPRLQRLQEMILVGAERPGTLAGRT